MVIAITLFVASVVAPPLFVDTADATALRSGLAANAGARYGDESGDLRVTWDALVRPAGVRDVLDELAAIPSYADPVLTATDTTPSLSSKAVAAANGATTAAALWTHDGAIEALGGDPDADGVWLPSDAADELRLQVGDPVKVGVITTFLGLQRRLAPTVLAGTYDPAPGSVLPPQLADLPDARRWYYPANAELPNFSLPLAIVGQRTFDRMVLKIRDSPIYTADLVLDPDVTPDEAAAAIDRAERLEEEVYDGSTDLFAAFSRARPAPAKLSVISGLPRITEAADDTATSAQQQVRPYAVGGEVLAGVLLVAAWVLLGRSRRREQLLASGLGLRPFEFALLAGLEVLLLCLAAVPAGVGLAVLSVRAVGPSGGVHLPVGSVDTMLAAEAAAVALLLLVVTTGLAAFATDRLDRISRFGRGWAAAPWGILLVVATAVASFVVLSADTEDRSQHPLVAVFPFLVAASVTLVVIRTVAWARSRRTTRARPGTPRWLAARRSGPVVREVIALTSVVAMALCLFAYTLTVYRGIDVGVVDKTAALSGATTTIVVDEDFRSAGTAVAVGPPTDDTTVVWRRGVTLPPEFGQFPLMAIDPTTFADVADWGASAEFARGRSLVPELALKAKGVPVLLVGDTDLEAGASSVLVLDGNTSVPIHVVDVLAAFPGSETELGTLTAVISSRRIFALVPPLMDPRKRTATSISPGAFTSTVWSRGSGAELRAELDDAGVQSDGPVETAAAARIDNGLVATTWAGSYVLALGAVLLALALAAGFVLALRLAERDTVADVVLRRMGFRSGALARARAWEVAYTAASAAAAAAVSVAVLVLVPTSIDAVPDILPLTHPRVGVVDVVVPLGALVVVVLLAWLVGSLPTRRRDPAEVLRAGD